MKSSFLFSAASLFLAALPAFAGGYDCLISDASTHQSNFYNEKNFVNQGSQVSGSLVQINIDVATDTPKDYAEKVDPFFTPSLKYILSAQDKLKIQFISPKTDAQTVIEQNSSDQRYESVIHLSSELSVKVDCLFVKESKEKTSDASAKKTKHKPKH